MGGKTLNFRDKTRDILGASCDAVQNNLWPRSFLAEAKRGSQSLLMPFSACANERTHLKHVSLGMIIAKQSRKPFPTFAYTVEGSMIHSGTPLEPLSNVR